MTTPNKITIARIFCIPAFVTMAIYYGRGVAQGHPQEWQRWLALAIFALAAASDGVDGYIARRYNQRSKLGLILDPIADKGLMFAGMITLSISNWRYEFPVWFPVLVITRDITVLVGIAIVHMLNNVVHVRPRWTGKTATALQMVALIIIMLQWNPFTWHFHLIGHAIPVLFVEIPIWLAGVFTAISGIELTIDGITQLHDRGHGEAGFSGGAVKREVDDRTGDERQLS